MLSLQGSRSTRKSVDLNGTGLFCLEGVSIVSKGFGVFTVRELSAVRPIEGRVFSHPIIHLMASDLS